jgi:hypothetical protein
MRSRWPTRWGLSRQKTNQQNNQSTEQIFKPNHIDQQANISTIKTQAKHMNSLRMPCYKLQPSANWCSDTNVKKKTASIFNESKTLEIIKIMGRGIQNHRCENLTSDQAHNRLHRCS